MRKNKLIYLGVIGAILCGCNNNITSSSSNLTNNQSSTSREPVSYELTNDMIDELAEGYQVLGIYTAYIKDEVSVTNYYSYNCTETVYEFTAWEEVKENPTQDKVTQSYRYEGFNYGTTKAYLSQAKLNLNNEVMNYIVTDGYGNLLTWDSTGFGNTFDSLTARDFFQTDNEFEFSLNMEKLSLTSVYKALTSQFSSYMGLEMTSFRIQTDGYKIKSYFMDFKPLTTMSGSMYITVEGEFTKTGSDVVKPLEPMEGPSNAEFDEKFVELQKQNYRLDVDLGVKSYKMSLENANNLIFDEYDKNGIKLSSYGYYQKTDSTLQGVTKINGTIYEDGVPVSGTLWNIIPTLEISSVLFTYNEKESTNDRKVFNYREDAPNDIAMYYDYGMMAGSIVGDLTIIIEEDRVTIENKLSMSTEKFVYYDIGNVKNSFDNIQGTCDGLKWSEILSNQVKELEKLYSIVPQEALDLIPTFGGKYANVQLDASYRPTVPAIVVPVYNSTSGTELYTQYVDKLLEAGFELNSEHSTDKLEAYTKDCLVNGESKKVCVKIYFAADYLSGTQFVMFPSIVD